MPSSLLTGNIHAWHFDEASGTRNDSIVTNHLSDINSVGTAAGKSGNAALFVAANSQRLTGTGIDTSGDYHIDFWFYRTETGQHVLWLNRNENTYLYIGVTGVLDFVQERDGSAFTLLHYQSALAADTWYLIEAEMSGGNMYLWVNNNPATNNGQALGGTQTADDDGFGINFGGYSSGFYSSARIDEPGFWNRAFTTEEHAERYNDGDGFFYPFAQSSGGARQFSSVARARG